MNKKLKQSKTIFLFALLFLFFLIINNVLSQNLSFDELVNLQKEKKKNINKLLTAKAWMQDTKTDKKWIFSNRLSPDIVEAIFVLQDENCDQNIINYIMGDSSTYNELKDSFSKVSEQKNIIYSAGRNIEDYVYKDLYIRFFKTREVNKIDFYAVWIFSMTDGWYFKKLDKFCMPIINNNTTGKSTTTNAEFPGGKKEKQKFIERNMEYPNAAIEMGIQGSVLVSFNVETDGSLTNIEIVKGLEGGFNEEVIRLIKLMPKWKPAFKDGKPVKVKFTMPMTFSQNE